MGDMSSLGIFNSVRIQTDLTACAKCGSTARIANGLCVSCMLEPALEGDGNGGESLAAAFAEIDVRDADWRAGNYQILEEIGRGGMGVIYRARQRHSRRIVALKRVLSYHADSRETLARFRREAEAAASLDHPNILPIYEVSEGEDGLPFFSMKFAPGGSLLEVAPALRSEPRRSVALMAKVARAVEYAHGQGILHRDLKPGNILLDGRGEPLVSDFGLAKWLDTTSDVTRTLTIFGTPGYIAPEQARGPAAKLTSEADVYSLGAILFVLFTGRPPFLGEHALAVIQQAAEKPAPKLRTLAPALDRDLQTICARCLEREPQARYHSAGDLAEDLERWLQGRPTVTRPVLPSTRIWRWSRRNPTLVGTAAACLLLGAASIWVLRQSMPLPQTSAAAKKARLSPQVAAEQSKLRQALFATPGLQEETAELHLASGRRSVQERFYSALANQFKFDEKSLRERLPKFAEEVKRDPDAPIFERMSAAYLLRDFEEMERLALRAADEAERTIPSRPEDALRAFDLAAVAARKSNEFARARDHLREAEKLTDQQRNPIRWADIQYSVVNVLLAWAEQGKEAEKILRSVIEVRVRAYGPEHRETLKARRRLRVALYNQGKYEEAEAQCRDLLKIDEKIFGAEHPETLFSRWDLAVVMGNGDKREEAMVEIRRVLNGREKALGPEHPETIRTRIGLTANLANLGHYREAITQMRELVKTEEKVFGPDDEQTLNTLINLGEDLAIEDEYIEAEATLRRALPLAEKTAGRDSQLALRCRGTLAVTLAAQGRPAEAEAEAREVVKLADMRAGAERSGWTRDLLATLLDWSGKHAEAEVLILQALRLNEKALGGDNRETLKSRGHLAKNLWYQGKNAEAETRLRELIALNEKAMGARAYRTENNMSSRLFEDLTPLTGCTLLANTLRDQQRYPEAEAEYKHVIALDEKELGPDNHDTLDAYYNFAYQLGQQHRTKEAKPFAQRAATGALKIRGPNDPYTRKYLKFLEALESEHAITMPEAQFRETFASGTRGGEQAQR
jgi:serine/threonine protein kinase